MFSYIPSDSSTQVKYSRGIRLRSSGAIPSLPQCQVSIARPPFGAAAPVTTASAFSKLLIACLAWPWFCLMRPSL